LELSRWLIWAESSCFEEGCLLKSSELDFCYSP